MSRLKSKTTMFNSIVYIANQLLNLCSIRQCLLSSFSSFYLVPTSTSTTNMWRAEGRELPIPSRAASSPGSPPLLIDRMYGGDELDLWVQLQRRSPSTQRCQLLSETVLDKSNGTFLIRVGNLKEHFFPKTYCPHF
jgi:hypothetical protein